MRSGAGNRAEGLPGRWCLTADRQLREDRQVSEAHGSFLQTKRFKGLDGLRCLAILPVIAHHATPRPLPGILGKGAVGVDLFFALSGFLITTLLLRKLRDTQKVNLKAFYVRRSLRIFPLYYAVLGAYLVYAWLLPSAHPERVHLFANWFFHATYTANWFANYHVSHAIPFAFSWSLCVEEQFYLFWPILVASVRSRGWLMLIMAGLVFMDWRLEHGGLALWFPSLLPWQRVLTSFATPIGLGSLLGLVLDGPRGFAILSRVLVFRPFALLCLLASVLVLLIPNTPYFSLCVLLTLLVGAVAIQPKNWISGLLENRFVVLGGQLSYAAYLTHVTALAIVRRVFPEQSLSTLFVFCLGLPLIVALAAFAHFGLERPGVKWLRKRLQVPG